MGGIIRSGTALGCVPGYRMAHVDSGRIIDMRPVGDDASRREFPCAVALFIFIQIAPAHHDLGFAIARGKRVCRNAVNLAFRNVATDGEVGCRDVVLHRPDIGPGLGKGAQKSIDGAR
jgi:hypothetical protein